MERLKSVMIPLIYDKNGACPMTSRERTVKRLNIKENYNYNTITSTKISGRILKLYLSIIFTMYTVT